MKWIILIGVLAALELFFGTHDYGWRVALSILTLCCVSIAASLAFGRFAALSMASQDDDDIL